MISFLDTVILSALALAALPILIHLLNRQKARIVPFASLRFLKALQKNKIRRLKFRQILLLIIRTLILAFAVLAFARPVSKSAFTRDIRSHASTSIVIVLDNSMSMGYTSAQGTLFSNAQTRAMEIIGYLNEEDEVAVVTTVPPDPASQFNRSGSVAASAIRSVKPKPQEGRVREALERAGELLKQARHVNREIYIISDMMENDWNTMEGLVLDPAIVVSLISCQSGIEADLAIAETQVTSKLIEQGKPVQLQVSVTNRGRRDSEDKLIQIYLEGHPAGQAVVTVPAGEDWAGTVSITPNRSGWQRGYAEIEDDALMDNNRRYFWLYVPEQVRVLIAGATARNAELMTLALKPDSSAFRRIIVETIRSNDLGMRSLTDIDVLILADNLTLSDAVLMRIKRHLDQHGNLIVMPGETTDLTQWNRAADRLGFDPITTFRTTSAEGGFSEITRWNLTHPILTGIFDNPAKVKTLVSPKFKKYAEFKEKTGNTILGLSTGAGWIREYQAGGTILALSSPPDLAWNDVPLRGLYAPLLHRMIMYLQSQRQTEAEGMVCGQRIDKRVRSRNPSQPVEIEEWPEAITLKPNLETSGDRLRVRLASVDRPGCYRIKQTDPELVFTANPPIGELNHRTISESHIASSWDHSFFWIDRNADLASQIMQSRYGAELWKWPWLAVLLLLVVEMIVAQPLSFDFFRKKGLAHE